MVRVPAPRMGRLNGEAGERPALSRNCELARASQAARPDQFHHTLVERRWERLCWIASPPPLFIGQGILIHPFAEETCHVSQIAVCVRNPCIIHIGLRLHPLRRTGPFRQTQRPGPADRLADPLQHRDPFCRRSGRAGSRAGYVCGLSSRGQVDPGYRRLHGSI